MKIPFIFLMCVQPIFTIRWLAIQHTEALWNSSIMMVGPSSCRQGWLKRSLDGVQARVCRRSLQMMPFVAQAASYASGTCKTLFANRRWNCSSIDTAPDLAPDLTRGTREQAFVYALSSAAVTHVIARACASGSLHHCSCSSPPGYPPNGSFKWGGCGDNVKEGVRFAKQFIDSIEKIDETENIDYRKIFESIYEKSKKFSLRSIVRDLEMLASKNLNKANNQTIKAHVKLYHNEKESKLEKETRKLKRLKALIAAVNLHNNRVGRRAVKQSQITQCKCHGVSGSCNIKTCWRSLPTMTDIGSRLQRRYSEAIEVVNRNIGGKKKILPAIKTVKSFNNDVLIYVAKSPDYCNKDEKVGSLGTEGRLCNVTSEGTDSCRYMCCGRGYRTVVEERIERCHCKYYYCCYVRCKICRTITQTHECN